jgi:putative oxidoreductase
MQSRVTEFGVLLLRVWIGLNFVFAHGVHKVMNHEAFLSGHGVHKFPAPLVMGTIALLSEFLGGILLTLGLATRVAALFIFGTMMGAALVVHGGDPWGRKELALTYAVISLFFMAHGGGLFSLDRLLNRLGLFRWRRPAAPAAGDRGEPAA